MNIKAFSLVAVALVSQSAFASDEVKDGVAAIEQYSYGMSIDIAKIICSSNVHSENGVDTQVMTYIDHHGTLHRVQYLKESDTYNNS